MKKILFLAIIAVAGVVTTAFTLLPSGTGKTVVEDKLYWFDEFGVYTGNHREKSQEISTGCPDGSGDICERGYDNDDLNTPGVPQDGLNMSAVENDVILKQ